MFYNIEHATLIFLHTIVLVNNRSVFGCTFGYEHFSKRLFLLKNLGVM